MRTTPLLALAALAASGCSEYDLYGKDGTNGEAGPNIVVTPQTLVWDTVAFGSSEVKSFTVTNEGNDDLEVQGALLDGVGTFVVNSGALPLFLGPGESTDIEVAYIPDTSTEDTAVVDVLSNDPDSPEVPVELIASAGSPELQITPDVWDYGSLPLYCNSTLELTLSNVGTAPLEVSDIGGDSGDYTLDNLPTLPFTIQAGDSEVVDLTWLPSALGTSSNTVTVTSNDPFGDRSATQSGLALDQADCLPVEEGGSDDYVLSFTAEYQYADVAFLLDTTGSMSGLANSMASEFSSIASALTGVIPDITFGVATYDDYYYGTMGSYNDLPFILRQQQTDSLSGVQSVLNSIPLHSGYDQPESTLEALYQAASGAGYDQNCNRSYDSLYDVPPFIADSSDAFYGGATGIYNSGVSGTGTLGGMGFRDGTLPIIIYATDAPFRDPGSGYSGPGGCTDATMSSAIAALNDINARTIGIGVQLYGNNYFDQNQFRTIAQGTNSYGDMDGNGTTEEAFVVWSGASSTFQNTIVDAVTGLVEGATFDEIRLDIYGDTEGVVSAVTPEAYYNVASGEVTDFTVEVTGVPTDSPGDDVVVLDLVLVGVLPTGGELTLQTSQLYVINEG